MFYTRPFVGFIFKTAKRAIIIAVIPEPYLNHDKLKYAIKRLELEEELLELDEEQELEEQELEHELDEQLEVCDEEETFVTLAGSDNRLVYLT